MLRWPTNGPGRSSGARRNKNVAVLSRPEVGRVGPAVGLGDEAQAVGPRLERRVLQVGADHDGPVVLGVDVVVAREPAPFFGSEPAMKPRPQPGLFPRADLGRQLQGLVVRPAAEQDPRAAGGHVHGELPVGEEAAIGISAPAGAIGVTPVARRDDRPDRQRHRAAGTGPVVLDLDDEPGPVRPGCRGLLDHRIGGRGQRAGGEQHRETGQGLDHDAPSAADLVRPVPTRPRRGASARIGRDSHWRGPGRGYQVPSITSGGCPR